MKDRIEADNTSPQVQPLSAEAAAQLDTLFRLHQKHLVYYIASRLNYMPDRYVLAEDIAQETWADLARYPGGPIRKAPEDAFGLVALRARQAIGRHFRRKANGGCERPADWTDEKTAAVGVFPSHTDEYERVLLVESLPPVQSAMFKLAAQGLSQNRIARQMGRRQSTVWKNLHRAQRNIHALALAG